MLVLEVEAFNCSVPPVPQGRLPAVVKLKPGAVDALLTAIVAALLQPVEGSVTTTVYTPAALTVITEPPWAVLHKKVTEFVEVDVAVSCVVLVEGEQPIPILELLEALTLGTLLFPVTVTVMAPLEHPVTVSVIANVYVPGPFTDTLLLLVLPTIEGPLHVYV